ncbi:putative serine esterase (DUF676) [Fragilaria crotonensis]|nr:putative serine esterase (DUF676) [Fragilaria crotonensis]
MEVRLLALILILIVFQFASSLAMGASISSASDLQQNEEEPFTHLVVLVHGLKGSEQDLAYLANTLERQAHKDTNVVLHRSSCNSQMTHDGVQKGGERLKTEVEQEIKKIEGRVRLSFVANSMGGLYARYAIAHIDMADNVTPLVFCTTSTPHLGCCNHTYVPLPRWAETTIGKMMAETGNDLFGVTTIVQEMGTSDFYLDPLRKFQRRVALANAFATDSLVPVGTAAFLSKSSDYLHKTLPKSERYVLAVQTEPNQEHDPDDMSQRLDSLGWTKLFLDVRDTIPLPSIPIPFRTPAVVPDRDVWTSKELFPVLNQIGSRWQIPLGHTVGIANSRNSAYSWFTAGGQPFMDQLAQDLLLFMGVPLSDDKDETDTADHEEITEAVDKDDVTTEVATEVAPEVAPDLIVVDAEGGEL